ncbi:hypothetical protein ABEG17_02405 [Pedococcus sp. KACC 23699]|uniref:ApeA N-terminal domain-containing protein n=1 Tax=Pedococcus sp. KACC 23699 TaxID=3149228 RepID=A0AAU7JUV5_9MICO
MTEEPYDGSWEGVWFPSQGQLQVRNLSIRVTEEGEVASDVQVAVRSDVWPDWLSIAAAQRDAALEARASSPDREEQPQAFHAALTREFRGSVTSLCSSAFAMEAFANTVHHYVPSSKASGKSADARIHQTLQRAFILPNDFSKESRRILQEIFRFRDGAVHPAAAFTDPVGHPTWRVGMERRYVIFRVENAVAAHLFAETTIKRCLRGPRNHGKEFTAWCSGMLAEMEASSSRAGTGL